LFFTSSDFFEALMSLHSQAPGVENAFPVAKSNSSRDLEDDKQRKNQETDDIQKRNGNFW